MKEIGNKSPELKHMSSSLSRFLSITSPRRVLLCRVSLVSHWYRESGTWEANWKERERERGNLNHWPSTETPPKIGKMEVRREEQERRKEEQVVMEIMYGWLI